VTIRCAKCGTTNLERSAWCSGCGLGFSGEAVEPRPFANGSAPKVEGAHTPQAVEDAVPSQVTALGGHSVDVTRLPRLVRYWLACLLALATLYPLAIFFLLPLMQWEKTGVWSLPTRTEAVHLAIYWIPVGFFIGTVAWLTERLDRGTPKKKRARQ